MKQINYTHMIIPGLCLLLGGLFFAYQAQWIILFSPFSTQSLEPTQNNIAIKPKSITLYFWKHEKWQKETSSIIWSHNQSSNIKILSNQWFNLMEDEGILDHDIQAMSVIISQNHEAFISLNKYLFHQSDATYHKMMVIEGLLKTLHQNGVKVQSVRFLIHHQPLKDDHLNFNFSWPLTGYIKSQ